jgi:HD-like signal output (HDOD) protein
VAYDQLRAGRELAQFRGKAEAAWRHSVEVASLCYVIAANLTRISADEGLFAGLVHDIGYFYLLSLAPRYPELEAHPEALDAVLREWHPSIGQAVLHSFGLSPAVMDAVGEHEIASPHSPPRSMTDVVRLANLAAAQTNPARDPAAPVTPLEDPQLRTLIAESHDHLRSLVAALHS